MLSVLIPIYNFNVEALVNELVDQCRKAGINFEILCFDDFSRKKFRKVNHVIAGKFGVSYIELSENYGRSKIRNTLAKNARYDYLLFLDCDSKIIKQDFIKTYLEKAKPNLVVNGGRVYKDKPSRSKKKRLHWKYGINREALSSRERDQRGSSSFHTNNFLIPRLICLKNPFNMEISGYGYEDVIFASDLEKNKVKIKNIDNQVEHLGLEYTEVFLQKTDKAIQNLVFLNNQGFVNHVSMVKSYNNFKSYGILKILLWLYKILENKILSNLNSPTPSLRFFDLYRLTKFHKYKSEIMPDKEIES